MTTVFDDIARDLTQKNSLCLLSKGTKTFPILAKILDVFSFDPISSLILLLNFDSKEIELINQELLVLRKDKLQIYEISNETSVKRSSLYLKGGIIAVSNVILVLDLLQKAISPSIVTKLVINKADRINGFLDKEAWITTIIKRENKNLHVIGISDNSEVLHSTQSLKITMNAIYSESCTFWPLFRAELIAEINKNTYDSFEYQVKISKSMLKIQTIIMNIIRICAGEFNRVYKDRNLGDFLLTEDEILNSSIGTLNLKITKLSKKFNIRGNTHLKDVFSFRYLLFELVSLDSIGFYFKVIQAKESAPLDSVWYVCDKKTLEQLDELIAVSKSRVYKIEKTLKLSSMKTEAGESEKQEELIDTSPDGQSMSNSNQIESPKKTAVKIDGVDYQVELGLELNPKFKALEEVLNKIKEKHQALKKAKKHLLDDSQNPAEPLQKIWIFTSSEARARELQVLINSFMVRKDNHMLRMHWKLKNLLKYQKMRQSEQKENQNDSGGKDKKKNTVMEEYNRRKRHERIITDLILEELKDIFDENESDIIKSLFQGQGGDMSGESPKDHPDSPSQLEKSNTIEEEEEKSTKKNFINLVNSMCDGDSQIPLPTGIKKKTFKTNKYINRDILRLDILEEYDEFGNFLFKAKDVIPGFEIVVNSLNRSIDRQEFLKKRKPQIVIFYDTSVGLLREIMMNETYLRLSGQEPVVKEMHILLMQNSIESAVYLNQIKKEHESFVALFKERSGIVLNYANPEVRIKQFSYPQQSSTRKGLGLEQRIKDFRPIVIVDKREFNSLLPSRLYHDGYWVIPILLEKGDYIITNEICIERKSVETGDLLNSLRSGRLESQIKAMCASFLVPILLIEFSDTIDFNLETAEVSKIDKLNASWYSEIEGDKKSNVKMMLSLLCLKFPKLRIIWSKSVEFSSKVFASLKNGKMEPDPKLFLKYQEENEKNDQNWSVSQIMSAIGDGSAEME